MNSYKNIIYSEKQYKKEHILEHSIFDFGKVLFMKYIEIKTKNIVKRNIKVKIIINENADSSSFIYNIIINNNIYLNNQNCIRHILVDEYGNSILYKGLKKDIKVISDYPFQCSIFIL